MREIKFRFWQFHDEKYYYPQNFDAEFGQFGWSSCGHLDLGVCREGGTETFQRGVLEQYTGLKDKNGKEIYEGDIVKFERGEPDTSVVEWISEEDGWDYTGWMIDHFHCQYGEREVIGNIHENPELV